MIKLERSSLNYREIPTARGQVEETSEKKQEMCKVCEHFEEGQCLFFKELNKKMSDCFDMEIKVAKNGLCNAYTPMKQSIKNLKRRAYLKREEEKDAEKKGRTFID